jgi:hypothetical protein
MPTPRTLESGGSIVAGDRTPLAARIAEKPAPGAPGDGARKRVCGILGLRDPDDDYQCGRFRCSIVLGGGRLELGRYLRLDPSSARAIGVFASLTT